MAAPWGPHLMTTHSAPHLESSNNTLARSLALLDCWEASVSSSNWLRESRRMYKFTRVLASSRVASTTFAMARIFLSAPARSESIKNMDARGPGSKNTAAPFSFAMINAARTAASSSSSKINPFTNIAELFDRACEAMLSTSETPPSNGQGPRSYREQNAWFPSPSVSTKQTKVRSDVDSGHPGTSGEIKRWNLIFSSARTSVKNTPCLSGPACPTQAQCKPILEDAMRKLQLPPTSQDSSRGAVAARWARADLDLQVSADGTFADGNKMSIHALPNATTSTRLKLALSPVEGLKPDQLEK